MSDEELAKDILDSMSDYISSKTHEVAWLSQPGDKYEDFDVTREVCIDGWFNILEVARLLNAKISARIGVTS